MIKSINIDTFFLIKLNLKQRKKVPSSNRNVYTLAGRSYGCTYVESFRFL